MKNLSGFYREILNAVNDAVVVHDASTGKILYVNAFTCDMYGYSSEEFLMSDAGLVSLQSTPFTAEDALQWIHKTVAQGHQIFEWYSRKKSGELFWAEVTMRHTIIEGHNLVVVTCRDITDRKQAQEIINEQEVRFRTIFEKSPVSIELYDDEGKLIHANEACLRLFGVSDVSDIRGFNLFENPHVSAESRESLNRGESVFFQTSYDFSLVKERHLYATSRSDIIYIDVVITPFSLDHKEQRGYMVQIQDITVRKKALEALRESEDRFRHVLENSLDALYRRNYRTNTYDYVSPAVTRITGYTPEEMMGRTREETGALLLSEDREKVDAVIENLISEGGGLMDIEYRLRHKNGQIRWLHDLSTLFLDPHGNPEFGVGSIHDITEYKNALEALELSLREKDALLKELYHRTKNNMQVICSLMALQASQSGNEHLRQVLKELENRIRSMALVHEKLYQSKSLSSINMREYISDLTRLLIKSYCLGTSSPVIDFDMEDIFCIIDTAVPCGLIINELISNSLKHAFHDSGKGRIAVRMKKDQHNMIEITISDNGGGAPPGFDFRRDGRMGLQTIYALGEDQLQGTVVFSNDTGLCCTLQFRDTLYSERV